MSLLVHYTNALGVFEVHPLEGVEVEGDVPYATNFIPKPNALSPSYYRNDKSTIKSFIIGVKSAIRRLKTKHSAFTIPQYVP